jgi:hypothetical protein
MTHGDQSDPVAFAGVHACLAPKLLRVAVDGADFLNRPMQRRSN